jgi:NADH-quinone oxidoreductase subunit L
MEFNEKALLAIVLLPMLGAVLNGIAGCFFKAEKKVVSAVAVGSVFLSFLLAVYGLVALIQADDPKTALTYKAYEWFSVQLSSGSTLSIDVAFSLDALSGMMAVMVTGIGLLIHIYALSYMSEEPSFARFFAYLNLFMASMLILVLGANMPLMFVGWEGVGLCSYLLIGFWFENADYAAAGKKAFIVNRIGDFGVLMGMFVLASATGSFDFSAINQVASGLTVPFQLGAVSLPCSVATLAALFLFLGCTGKSAQLPLYVWLPDAMAGPTPVSALIHAATMVTSGVYLCCRLSPVFVQSPSAMAVIAVVGTLTALVAASIALVQNQLKKVLAYSTVSQLGFMFAAVGVGAFNAGIFHVFTHAFFKACLFLGAGSVMHSVHAHGDADLNDLGGMKKFMPITSKTFLVSCLAIAGIVPFAGFFSKDMILHGALTVGEYFDFAPWLGQAVFAALCVGAFTTAFYMFRLYFLTFTGEFRGGHGHGHDDHGHDDHGKGHAEPHESDALITVPLVLLAAGAALVGFLGMPAWLHLPDFWSEWLHGVVAGIPDAEHHHHDATSGAIAMAAGTAVAIGGVVFAYTKYCNKPWHGAEQLTPLHQFLMDKWRVDEFYDALLIRPMTALAVALGNVDRVAVDGLTKLAALSVSISGFLFTRLQNGVVHVYGAGVAFGLVVLTWWVLYPHPDVSVSTKEGAAHLVAGSGLGYQYRWDLNSDGVYDIDWGDQRDVQYAFDGADLRAIELTLIEVMGRNRGPYVVRLEEGDSVDLDPSYLGDAWRTNADSTKTPRVTMRGTQLLVHPGASSIKVDGIPASGDEIPVPVGTVLSLGEFTQLRIDALVRSTLEVKSAFGNVARTHLDIAVHVKATGAKAAALHRPRAKTAARARPAAQTFAQRGEAR